MDGIDAIGTIFSSLVMLSSKVCIRIQRLAEELGVEPKGTHLRSSSSFEDWAPHRRRYSSYTNNKLKVSNPEIHRKGCRLVQIAEKPAFKHYYCKSCRRPSGSRHNKALKKTLESPDVDLTSRKFFVFNCYSAIAWGQIFRSFKYIKG